MIIAAFSDLDVFEDDIDQFLEQLDKMPEPDLILLAGDIYYYRKPEVYKQILSHIKWKCPIVAVFGNREFPEDVDRILKACGKRVIFLDDGSVTYKIKGESVGIVGSRGCLDYPTLWQMEHMTGVVKTYEDRLLEITKLLSSLKTDIKILLTHYAPTYKTLEGEYKQIYQGLGSRKLEKVLTDTKTTLAVHGHAHYGIPLALVGKVPVYNVSYLIKQKITMINTDKLSTR